MATLADLLGGGENPLMGLLSPEQQSQAKQQAQNNLLTQLGFGLLQASRGAPGTGKPSLGQIIGQVGPSAVSAYQGSFDKTLKDLVTSMQVKDMMAKREREANLQKALQGAMKPTMTMADYERAQSNIDPMALESSTSEIDVMRQATPTGPVAIDRNRALAALAQYGGTEGLGAYLSATQPQKPTGKAAEYEYALRSGIIPKNMTFAEFAGLGKGPLVQNILGGEKLTPGQEKIDTEFAKEYVAWRSGGGQDAVAQIAQLKPVINMLEEGKDITGLSVAIQPDLLLSVTNPEALQSREQVEEVVQRNLRAVLGPQFTAAEGERLIARAYNPKLKPEENAKRLRRLFLQMATAAEQKQEMATYFEKNGTLRGYSGKMPSIADFEMAIAGGRTPEKRRPISEILGGGK